MDNFLYETSPGNYGVMRGEIRGIFQAENGEIFYRVFINRKEYVVSENKLLGKFDPAELFVVDKLSETKYTVSRLSERLTGSAVQVFETEREATGYIIEKLSEKESELCDLPINVPDKYTRLNECREELVRWRRNVIF